MEDEGSTKRQRGDPGVLSEILGNESAQLEDRTGAAEKLGNLGTLAGTVGANALFSALQGDPKKQKYSTEAERIAANIDRFVRVAAVKALSKLDVLAAPYVIKMIQSSQQASTYHPEVKDEVGKCIQHLGIAAVPPLLEALTNRDDSTTRLLAATWMYHSGIALLPHIDELIKILQANQTAEDEKMRVMIAAALGNIGRHHKTPDYLGEVGPVSRYEAALLPEPAVGSKRAEQFGFVAAALIKVMQDDVSEKVQASAVTALASLPTQFIVPHAGAIITVVINNDAPDEIRCRSIRTLCRLGSDANPYVAQLVGILIGHGDETCKSRQVPLAIIKALKDLGSTTAAVEHMDTLKRIACESQYEGLAFAAATTLGSLGGGSESATILAKYVTMHAAKSSFGRAMEAAEALGKLAELDKEAVKPHVKALQALMSTDEVHSDLQCCVADVLDNMNESY